MLGWLKSLNEKIVFSRKEFLFLIFIFLLAFNLRILYLKDYVKLESYYPILEGSDSFSYLRWAENIAGGNFFGKKIFIKPPLYAYLLASLLRVFQDKIGYIYFLQFILGSANCILIYLICRKMFDKLLGLTAVIFYVGYGLVIFYEGLLLPVSLSLSLNLILFLLLLYLGDNPTKKKIFFIGLFLGICILNEPNIIFLSILAFAILWERRASFKKFIYNSGIFILGVAIILFSISLRNYLLEKDWVLLSQNLGFKFYLGNNPVNPKGIFYYPFYTNLNEDLAFRDAKILARMETGNKDLKPSQISNFWFKKAAHFIIKEPLKYLQILLNKFIYLFEPKEYMRDWEFLEIKERVKLFKFIPLDLSLLIIFFYLGLIWGLKRLKENYLLYLGLVALFFSIVFSYIDTRSRIIWIFLYIIFASFGFYNLINLLFQKKYLKFLILFGMILLIYITFLPGESNFLSDKEAFFNLQRILSYKKTGDYQPILKESKLYIESKSQNPLILNTLGEIYYNMNDFKMVEEICKIIILKYPFFVDSYYNLGIIYNIQGRFLEAEEVLRQTLFMEPEKKDAYFELLKTYKELGDKIKAKQTLWSALGYLDLTNRETRKQIEQEFLKLIEDEE